MIQFDEHIFPTGWFNHQLVIISLAPVPRYVELELFNAPAIQIQSDLVSKTDFLPLPKKNGRFGRVIGVHCGLVQEN